jgi:PAS domain-containing protein
MNGNDHRGSDESEQRFRLVVEAAPNAMGMVCRAGEIVMANAQAGLEPLISIKEVTSLEW